MRPVSFHFDLRCCVIQLIAPKRLESSPARCVALTMYSGQGSISDSLAILMGKRLVPNMILIILRLAVINLDSMSTVRVQHEEAYNTQGVTTASNKLILVLTGHLLLQSSA